jgi:hypothetical protein
MANHPTPHVNHPALWSNKRTYGDRQEFIHTEYMA